MTFEHVRDVVNDRKGASLFHVGIEMRRIRREHQPAAPRHDANALQTFGMAADVVHARHSILDAGDMQAALDYYLASLLRPDGKGKALSDAGPVTLGFRLSSTKFPTGYEEVAYGRGTWLIHMLHEMFRDHASKDPDARFNAAIKQLISQLDGKSISNHDLQAAFEAHLPAELRYEEKDSLDWFFDGWVNGSAVPGFALKSVRASVRKSGVTFTGTITESDAPESLVTSVPIYAESQDLQATPIYLGRVFVDEPETSFTIAAPPGSRKLLLDPLRTVLRK